MPFTNPETRGDVTQPFETIESALEFMILLESVIADADCELKSLRERAAAKRYINGLDLALYKIHQLSFHIQKSRRILNDLTLIRGVLAGDSIGRAEAAAQENDPEALISAVGASV
jgi:hypothetical protein